MNHSGDAAEQIVRMSLEGTDIALRLTGSAAKNIAILMYSIIKGEQQSKGKARLTNMLKSGKELKVFTVKNGDLKKFQEEAKKYGVLYCVMKDKDNKNPDAIVDVMARAEDASKISRIMERFELSTVDRATVQTNVAPIKDGEKPELDIGVMDKDEIDKLLDDVLAKPLQKEEQTQNPQQAKMEKSPPSELSSKKPKTLAEGATKTDKPSVREKLRDIKNSRKAEEEKAPVRDDKDKAVKKPTTSQTKHTQPTKKKPKKSKER